MLHLSVRAPTLARAECRRRWGVRDGGGVQVDEEADGGADEGAVVSVVSE